MYYFALVACLIGVYFSSSCASIVDSDLMPGPKLNESMKEPKHKEKDVSDKFSITDMEPDMESIIHSKNKIGSDEQVEDSNIEPGTFLMESFLNLFGVYSDNNGPSPLDGKDNKTNISKNKHKGYGDSVTDEVDKKMQKEHTSESQESQSTDQQSQGLSSDRHLEQYGNSPHNTKYLETVAEGNTGYANILQEIYDDEDFQYILNITRNLDTMRKSINNDTHDRLYAEETSPEDVIDLKNLENTTSIKEEEETMTSRDSKNIKRENVTKDENVDKTRISFGDLVIQQTGSATGEQQNQQSDSIVNNRIRGDVPDVDFSSEMTTINQNNRNTENATTAVPRYLGRSPHGQDIDASSQKDEGNLEINNIKLSADPCISFHCKKGKMCKTDGHGNPFCACQDPDYCLPGNRNDLVCGTDNKTYISACLLFGTKCHLEGTKEGSHLHLDYQGPCKYIPPCTEYELAHFPFRMRDWLKNVLMQLYERDQDNSGLLSEKQESKVKKIYESEKRLPEGDHNIELLVKDFQKNYHMYVYPVHWQFHQLDQHLMDRLLTHSELAALRAPLMPIEHCVNVFLQKCDTNIDRHISLWEWCRCFGIKEDDIDEDLLF